MPDGIGFAAIEFDGANTSKLDNEAGGHRIQRIPPTERRGRVHTSTVTVAIVGAAEVSAVQLRDDEIRIEWFSGTGKGGQHRNKHQNCCRVIHLRTGIVQTATGRERASNLSQAKTALCRALTDAQENRVASESNGVRRQQVGSGMRGDKRRTYRFRDNRVQDHVTGKSCSCEQAMRGELDRLW